MKYEKICNKRNCTLYKSLIVRWQCLLLTANCTFWTKRKKKNVWIVIKNFSFNQDLFRKKIKGELKKDHLLYKIRQITYFFCISAYCTNLKIQRNKNVWRKRRKVIMPGESQREGTLTLTHCWHFLTLEYKFTERCVISFQQSFGSGSNIWRSSNPDPIFSEGRIRFMSKHLHLVSLFLKLWLFSTGDIEMLKNLELSFF